jgi:hypothetical protein
MICHDETYISQPRFCLNIGWLYTRLVASNSFAPEFREESEEEDGPSSEGASLLVQPAHTTRLNNSIREFMSMYVVDANLVCALFFFAHLFFSGSFICRLISLNCKACLLKPSTSLG